MSLPSFKIKHKQYLLAGVAGVVGMVVVGFMFWSSEAEFKPAVEQVPIKETNIMTAGQRINPQEVWVEQIQSENKLTRNKIEALEKLLMESIKPAESTLQEREEEHLYREADEVEASSQIAAQPAPQILPGLGESLQPKPPAQPMKKIVLNLTKGPNGDKTTRSTIENTIPAGAFAKAVLLGGVDAATTVQSQSDPRPVLLRVVDNGNLPRRFQSDLKACHLLASAYGDLSSERVFMRLEKLTCTERLTGEISETQVAGYIVGEDGRAGIRGVVADRAGPVLRNSLVGGFLSGVGQFFSVQQQKTDFPANPFMVPPAASGLNPSAMLTAGVAQGASKALDKYAEFYIKRLEQLQPVLQVAAGRQVDVVFTEGTQFGDTSVRQTISKLRNESRQKTIQTLEESQDNSDWLPSNKQGE